MTEKIEVTLNTVANQIKDTDEKIERIQRLVDYQGTLRVYTGDRGMDSAWEGTSGIICGAVSEQANVDINNLKYAKFILLSELIKKIVRIIDEELNNAQTEKRNTFEEVNEKEIDEDSDTSVSEFCGAEVCQ